MPTFWHGHFANQQSVVKNSYAMYRQNQLFREHAAGNFRGLLYGIVLGEKYPLINCVA